MVKITCVDEHSRAQKIGIQSGDILVSINGRAINDVLDYRFHLANRVLDICINRNNEEIHFAISKQEYDDIGLDFETPLMDKKHSCENKCIFCFIDQLPKGLRKSLYFKDDDSRLSFLHGNYITLTNLDDSDIDRIIEMHISPVNVSVHTTNPELRVKMMKNKRSGEVLKYLDRFAEAGIHICAQIVLCKGVDCAVYVHFHVTRKQKEKFVIWVFVSGECVLHGGRVKGNREMALLRALYVENVQSFVVHTPIINDFSKKSILVSNL